MRKEIGFIALVLIGSFLLFDVLYAQERVKGKLPVPAERLRVVGRSKLMELPGGKYRFLGTKVFPQGVLTIEGVRGESQKLYLISRDGERRLVGEEIRIHSPHFSPDGKKVLFTFRASYHGIHRPAFKTMYTSEIYLADNTVPFTSLERLTDDLYYDFRPRWDREGRNVYFMSARTGGLNIYRCPWPGDLEKDAVAITKFDDRGVSWYDVAADGRIDLRPATAQGDLQVGVDAVMLARLPESWSLPRATGGVLSGKGRCRWLAAAKGGGIEADGAGMIRQIEEKADRLYVADVTGDWREEIITSLPGEMRIYTTTIPAKSRRTCLMQDPIYRIDVAHAAMGYYQVPMLSK